MEPQRLEATTVSVWYSPRTVVRGARSCCLDAQLCVPPTHEFLHFPSRLFAFHAFFSLSFCFAFKRELNLLYLRGRIHRKHPKNSQNSIEEVEGRRRGIRRRRHWKQIERSTFYPSTSFLISFSFFQFLQF